MQAISTHLETVTATLNENVISLNLRWIVLAEGRLIETALAKQDSISHDYSFGSQISTSTYSSQIFLGLRTDEIFATAETQI